MVYSVRLVTWSVCCDFSCVRALNFTIVSRDISTVPSRDSYLLIVRDAQCSSMRAQIVTALPVR
jgi:hypothetical protein